jgi:methylated-DNA-protein-cysteine methyltransferase-like protein
VALRSLDNRRYLAGMKDSFFEQVYRVAQRIPRGKVATYGQIARLLGQPRAARTVGWALHSLPEGKDVPWQRVINSQGMVSLGSDRHGAVVQRVLLEGEGVVFDERGRVDLDVYGWTGLAPLEIRQILESKLQEEM